MSRNGHRSGRRRTRRAPKPQEEEQQNLCILNTKAELVDGVEGEVAGQAGEIGILGGGQNHQYQKRHHDCATGKGKGAAGRRLADGCAAVAGVPDADPGKHTKTDERDQREPAEAGLAERDDDEGGEQRADGRAGIATHLEEGLRQTVATAGCQTCNAGGFRMEDRRTDADEAGADHQNLETMGEGKRDEAGAGGQHGHRQREWHGPAIRHHADNRLQQRCCDLKCEGEQADLHEVERVIGFQQRIKRRQQRLHDVVQHMAEAGGCDD